MDMNVSPVGPQLVSARRRVLYAVVCATCHENGFVSADKPSLDTLLQMIQSIIKEIGRSAQAFCELSGRTEPLVGDVVMALIESGLDCDQIAAYAMRPNRVTIPTPQVMAKQSTPRILQAGEKKLLSSYIPDYFPSFPDPHSYIRTPTHKQPVTEYEAIREKSATQKRDVERALTKFMAKTCEQSTTHRLFAEEHMSHLFPLIVLKLEANPYLNALLPKDQVFENESEEHVIRKKDSDKKQNKSVTNTNELSNTSTTDNVVNDEDNIETNNEQMANNTNTNDTNKLTNTSNISVCGNTDTDVLDNPYLRPLLKLSSRKRSRKQFEA
ncbi:transcription initiation factor TFIID subunit 8-like [Oppia nitens]|uniref:transcription initiation factor TFIID subunit 8-like n=1 Tax=Oppia nitens TaxID=1686743 RepID=UPI0023D98DAA|nr:transcription initiation factor TFIID subunit 8-like [Oppia nitens]